MPKPISSILVPPRGQVKHFAQDNNEQEGHH